MEANCYPFIAMNCRVVGKILLDGSAGVWRTGETRAPKPLGYPHEAAVGAQ
jgi:hypothetical protein